MQLLCAIKLTEQLYSRITIHLFEETPLNMTNKKFFALWLLSAIFVVQVHATSLDRGYLNKNVEALSSDEMQGRKAPSEGHKNAQAYIIQEYNKAQLQPFPEYSNFQQTFQISRSDVQRKNLLGYIKGHKYPNLYWVVTAHYDHLGKKGKRVFNGANDNASGVAGLLSLLRYYSQNTPQYSLLFLATDAEEIGLHGAKYFVKHSPVALNQILININLDMIGLGGWRDTLYVSGASKLETINRVIEALKPSLKSRNFKLNKLRRYRMKSFSSAFSVDWSKSSDHAAFASVDIPYLYFGADVTSVYHTVNDDFSRINQDFLFGSVSAIIKITEHLQEFKPSDLMAQKG